MVPLQCFDRRAVLTGAAALFAAGPAAAQHSEAVGFPNVEPGTILISLARRRLFLTQAGGGAVSWPVAVGRSGRAWPGPARIAGKYVTPAWSPPAEVKRDNPRSPPLIPGGAPNNPMGARALTLDRHEIAIHGTSASMRASIGSAASYGCIRMLNEHVVDLFDRVSVGTPVLAV